MLVIEINADAIVERLQDMRDKLHHFKRVDIGNEMSEWQTADMHRHRPFTMRSRRKGKATTKVRPHSLYEVQASATYQRYLRRHHRPPRKSSNRPYLRETLLDVLIARYRELVAETLKW